MKTSGRYTLTSNGKWGNSLPQKLFFIALIMALAFASFPEAGVFAAPASDEITPIRKLEMDWDNKVRRLRSEISFFNSFQLKSEDSEKDQAKAQTYLARYRSALSKAQTIMSNHDGFDKNGHVTNENRARKSIRALAAQLQTLRGLRTKLNRL